jgi:hypothetical protein
MKGIIMSGWLTNGVPSPGPVTGIERFPLDTELSGGVQPQSASMSLQHLAAVMLQLANNVSTTPVAGTRYYVGVSIGFPRVITGVSALIGAVGGTDKFIYELHDSTGALVATTATAGVTVGTLGTWQAIPFTTPYRAAAGNYYIAVQLNGTTARLATYNSSTSPLVTGSATGTFGTGASITPPTTYTAGVGPVALLY